MKCHDCSLRYGGWGSLYYFIRAFSSTITNTLHHISISSESESLFLSHFSLFLTQCPFSIPASPSSPCSFPNLPPSSPPFTLQLASKHLINYPSFYVTFSHSYRLLKSSRLVPGILSTGRIIFSIIHIS